MVANNTVDGKLLAMPWFTEAGLLYYRKDLLEQYHRPVPKTWEEMTSTAKVIQTAERAKGRKNLWGYVFQGKAYEGLTCNASEWIASYNGGNFIESDGLVSINNPQAAKALDQAASWIGTISPKSTLDMTEEDARAQFQEGNAVFMRNWPYAWSLARMDSSVIKNKVGVAPLPQGGADGQHAASLGGWGLAVSKYSKHPNEAADLVLFLTSEQAQKNRAITGAYNPTIPALYHDGDVLNASPLFGELLEVFNHAVARPSTVTGAQYNEASEIIQNATHAVLEHQLSGAQAVQQMEEDLSSIGFQR
jgi:trehalose/maltose transport system substrate-binding protein